jgi:hypothetical protein
MSGGQVIERGTIKGKPYSVWKRWPDGWTRCFVGGGTDNNGKWKKGKRRSMRWLKEQKEAGRVEVLWQKEKQ